MRAVKDRLRERTLDIIDWIDYRPDPHWWPYVCAPAVLGVAYCVTPATLWPIMMGLTLIATVVALLVTTIVVLAMICWRVICDVVESRTWRIDWKHLLGAPPGSRMKVRKRLGPQLP